MEQLLQPLSEASLKYGHADSRGAIVRNHRRRLLRS
jgi:hypothetical protein